MRHKKILVMAAAMVVLSGCAGASAQAFEPTQSSLYITGEGVVTSATVEKYEADYYRAEELRAFVEDILTEWGGSGDQAKASVNECTFAEGTAKLLIDFKTPDAYMDFMTDFPDDESVIQVKKLGVTTVSDGITKGYLVGDQFYRLDKEKKEVNADEVMKQSKLNVAAVEGPALIQTDGAIVYISTDVEVIGTNLVQTPEEGMSYIVFK